MKKLHVTNEALKEISREELKNITGGGEIVNYLQCVSATLTGGGGGGIRSFVLGVTIFGMARMCGVMVGCSSL
jgi:bacteriocin-like protein